MKKTITKVLIISITIILLFILLFNVIKVQNIILKNIYPIKYEEYVSKYSKEYEQDEMLMYAIIKAESNFNPSVKSTSNAVGLMQLMENTAKEIANKMDLEYEENVSLYDPEININLGVKYFSNLMKEYKNNYLLALTAYNAGIGNLNTWIEKGIINKDGSNIEDIPFKETNSYVRKIVRDYEIYKELYEK